MLTARRKRDVKIALLVSVLVPFLGPKAGAVLESIVAVLTN